MDTLTLYGFDHRHLNWVKMTSKSNYQENLNSKIQNSKSKSTRKQVLHEFISFEMEEQRVIVKFYSRLGKSCADMERDLQAVFGEDAMKARTIRKWAERFREGRDSVSDDQRSGRPVTACGDEAVEALGSFLKEHPKATCRNMEDQLGMSKSSVFRILKDKMHYSKLCARWVPHTLSEMNKECRLLFCNNLMNIMDNDSESFMQRIVTGDETWLYAFDPEPKMQAREWRPKGSTPPVKAKDERSVGKKVMAAVFYDPFGLIYVEYLNQGETVTGERYVQILHNLSDAIRASRPAKVAAGVLFHHDNAPAHRSRVCLQTLSNFRFELLRHAPYSPDLSPCDFHLFPAIKRNMKGLKFGSLTEVKMAFENEIRSKPETFFRNGFESWRHRAARCIDKEGDYVEV